MEVHLKISKNATVKFEAEDIKQLMEQYSSIAEVFSEPCCGLCGHEDIRPNVRKVGEGKKAFTYYEVSCPKCYARLSFGQYADGNGLFPKRKLDKDGRPDMENGSFGPHKGWTKFRGQKVDEDEKGF